MTGSKKKLAAMLSGGIDSTVAAAVCLKNNYSLVGLTLVMKDFSGEGDNERACHTLSDNEAAARAAQTLGIEHRFISVKDEFKEKILRYSWNEYHTGKTPNPCVLCNYYLKFGEAVRAFVKEVGAEGVVTGHYSIIDNSCPDKVKLLRGVDSSKDQSYFLSALSQSQLNMCVMPLGGMLKSDVRALAKSLGLDCAERKESQDACFGLKGELFAQTLSRYFNQAPNRGFITNEQGHIIGEHNGIEFYTIGQRKGLNIALGSRAYVIKIDKSSNDVMVSTDASKLLCSSFEADCMNWLDFGSDSLECTVQTRYRQQEREATVFRHGDRAVVKLKEPLASVAPGQRLAVYKNSQLIAGGRII